MFKQNSPEHIGAYNRGAHAYLENKSMDTNPYEDCHLRRAWIDGWMDEQSNDSPRTRKA